MKLGKFIRWAIRYEHKVAYIVHSILTIIKNFNIPNFYVKNNMESGKIQKTKSKIQGWAKDIKIIDLCHSFSYLDENTCGRI